MREQSEAPRTGSRGAEEEGSGGHQSLHASKDTPAPYCRCPRQSDFWLCSDRPALASHPDGSRCALGATVAAAGNDHDPRGELIRALEGEGSR